MFTVFFLYLFFTDPPFFCSSLPLEVTLLRLLDDVYLFVQLACSYVCVNSACPYREEIAVTGGTSVNSVQPLVVSTGREVIHSVRL